VGVIVLRDDGRETAVKGNGGGSWSSDGVVLWLWRWQNGDAVGWWGEWPRLILSLYSSGGWESGSLGRVAYSGGVDLMLQFWLERGGDGRKHCRKMNRRQRARLGSMEKKCDMVWWCDDVGQRRGDTRGREREETMLVGLT
jgi:hypothetical protein